MRGDGPSKLGSCDSMDESGPTAAASALNVTALREPWLLAGLGFCAMGNLHVGQRHTNSPFVMLPFTDTAPRCTCIESRKGKEV